jgi:hypothetical protein
LSGTDEELKAEIIANVKISGDEHLIGHPLLRVLWSPAGYKEF